MVLKENTQNKTGVESPGAPYLFLEGPLVPKEVLNASVRSTFGG